MKAFLSAFLSFLMPGLGQFNNGQLLKGSIFYVLFLALFFPLYFLNLFQTIAGFVVALLIAISLYFFIVVEAFHFSRKNDPSINFKTKWPLFIFLLLGHFILSIFYQEYINSNFVMAHIVKTNSMEPTLNTGDYFIADYNYYKNNTIRPNDIVVLKFPKNPEQKFIERCIAVGGEVVEIKEGKVFTNGNKFKYSQWDNLQQDVKAQAVNFGPITIPPNSCYVLGDNRDNSYDSRYWGFVPIKNVVAKPLYIHWSNDKKRIGININ